MTFAQRLAKFSQAPQPVDQQKTQQVQEVAGLLKQLMQRKRAEGLVTAAQDKTLSAGGPMQVSGLFD